MLAICPINHQDIPHAARKVLRQLEQKGIQVLFVAASTPTLSQAQIKKIQDDAIEEYKNILEFAPEAV